MTTSLRVRCSVSWMVLATALVASNLWGQAATATVQGTVTDSSGAAVPDATVQIKNTGTGATRTVSTNGQGRYQISELAVGSYDAQASKAGFQTVAHNGITANVGAELVVDFAMPVGQQTQTVTVEGEVSQVETTNATVGTLTDQRQMRELPLNGRNFEQLILLTPGVQSISGNAFQSSGFQGRAAEYSIAGSRPTGQAILLDDENLQNFWNKGMGSVTGTSLGVEAYGEFQTLTNTYGAQFGGNGAVINAVSKSGTNNFHGSAYDFLRNSALDSRSFIDPSSVPPFRKNQFGGSIGGPIIKDKLFFFANYEGIRQLLGETQVANVPDCGTAGVCTPSASLPLASQQAIINTLALFPKPDPGTVNAATGLGRSTQVANQIAHEDYFIGRGDYNISNNDSFFLRYMLDRDTLTEPFGGGGFAGNQGIPLWPESDKGSNAFTTAEWRRILSPTMVNVARFSFSRTSTVASTTSSTPVLQFFPGSGRQDGTISIGGLSGIGGALQLPFNEIQNRFTEADDLNWTHGSQTIKMGASISRLQTNTYMPFRQGSQWAFSGLSGFLLGQPTAVTFAPIILPQSLAYPQNLVGTASYANRDFRDIEFTPYFQDDWKVSPKLTLNLGVRWEFMTNPIDKHDALYAITDFKNSVGFSHVPNVMVKNPTWHNFNPRVGFAFDPFSDHKTSIRGGFGVFRDLILPGAYAPAYWDQPPYTTFQAGTSVAGSVAPNYPNIPTQLGAVKPTSSPAWDYNSVTTTPYVMQYNLNIQREILPATLLTVGYVGSRGLHLLTQVELNPSIPTVGPGGGTIYGALNPAGTAMVDNPRQNTNLGSFPAMIPTTTSRYNSLQASLVHRFAHNFQLQGSYTYSRSIDDGAFLNSFNSNVSGNWGNPYNQNYDKSVSSFDIMHVISINGLYALPFKANRLVSGWQISGINRWNTGLPITILDNIDASGFGGGVSTRPDVNPGFSNNPIIGNSAQWYNPLAFSVAQYGTLGNLGRDTVRGPHGENLDVALLKDTKIREGINIQFRAEFFNVLNHTNYGLPINTLYTGFAAGGVAIRNPNAGRITTYTGTPRQIQFGLKIVF